MLLIVARGYREEDEMERNRKTVLQGLKAMKDICERDQSKCAQCPVQDICMEIKEEIVPSEMELPLE